MIQKFEQDIEHVRVEAPLLSKLDDAAALL
jgi:hypothetical protein